MLYQDILQALNRARVSYLVAGGFAVVLRGSDRTTHDLDIMVRMDERNLVRLVRVLGALGFRPKVPVRIEDFVEAKNRERWQREKGMLVFGLTSERDPRITVDVMLDTPFDFEHAHRRREVVRTHEFCVPLVGIADLIRMKREAGREQDVYDIGFLESLLKLNRRRKKKK